MSSCARNRVPVIPFGTGTGLEGQVVALEGGVSIDTCHMNRIIAVNNSDFDCVVEPGVTRKQLAAHLRGTGLFFSVDPGADASIGGMTATRASGTTTVRYGTMRENVLSLKAVLPDGRIVSTGTRARKSAAGLDLTHLFVGSEGILGVIVEITLRLHPIPEAVSAARVQFSEFENAVDAVMTTLQYAIPMARMELIDAQSIAAINRYSGTEFPIAPTLFVEFHGSEAAVRDQAATFGDICKELGGSEFSWAVHEEERTALWSARHDAAYAVMATRPGSRLIATDVCVPISRLADCILETQRDVRETSDMPAMLVGHVGDGNFHLVLLPEPGNNEQLQQLKELNARLIERALRMGGTSTGEHGVGIGKQAYLRHEFGDAAIDLMCAIKSAIDPDGIMNPGKKLPR